MLQFSPCLLSKANVVLNFKLNNYKEISAGFDLLPEGELEHHLLAHTYLKLTSFGSRSY